MRKILISSIITIITSLMFVGTALADPPVFDVKVSVLNIRIGPGLSYSIISQVVSDEDLPSGSTISSADGYRWMRVYYPDSNIGMYSSSRIGWGAWHQEINGYTFNFDYCTGVRVIKSTGIYEYKYPNLTSPYSMLYSYGQTIGCYDGPLYLRYETGYPNAWRLYRLDGTFDLGYGNGWHVTGLHR